MITVTAPSFSRGGRRSTARIRQPSRATQRLPRERGKRSRSVDGRDPGGATLFDRVQRRAAEAVEVDVLQPGGHARSALALERNDPGHSELDRFLHHPGKPIPVAHGNGECEGRRRRLQLGGVNLHHPFPAHLDQSSGSHQACPVEHLNRFTILGSPNLEVMDLMLIQTYPLPRFPAPPLQ